MTSSPPSKNISVFLFSPYDLGRDVDDYDNDGEEN
jgi:hypothetical protein